MVLINDKKLLGSFSETSELEWLETNGLGGWSGSSLSGCNTRRYHGLLMASIKPPTDRMLLVSKLDETIILDGSRFDLGTNDYGDTIFPEGLQWLSSFKKNFFPEWIYEVPGTLIRKTIIMVNGENTTLIRYEILKASNPFTLQLLPLIAARGYHELQHSYNNIFWDIDFENGVFHTRPFDGAPDIYISVPGSVYQSVNKWYYNFNYLQEKYRGLDYQEDLFNHGLFSVELKEGDRTGYHRFDRQPERKNAVALFEKELDRKLKLSNDVPDHLLRQLVLAADQFIVKRTELSETEKETSIDFKTVIAGYHWFTDWGRDTMISLPGPCLTTGRI